MSKIRVEEVRENIEDGISRYTPIHTNCSLIHVLKPTIKSLRRSCSSK
jgi:hypothetical protein